MGFGDWVKDRWGRGPSMNGLKSSVKGTIRTVGKVAPYAAGAALIPGVGGMLGGALGGIASKIPGAGAVLGGGADGKGNFGRLGDVLGKAAPALRAVGGKGQGGDGFGLDDALSLGLGAWSGIEGIQAQQRQDELLKRAMAGAEGDYASRAPLRDAGMQRLLHAERPDLSAMADDPGNPYAARLRAVRKPT